MLFNALKSEDKNFEKVHIKNLMYKCIGDLYCFIKNKTESFVQVPLINGNEFSNKEYKHRVGQEFNQYLLTRTTTSEIVKK